MIRFNAWAFTFPGGTAPLVSTALMTITLAQSGGVQGDRRLHACGKDGAINSALLFAARAAGATEIYRVGGAQAIAAMAYGTKTIRRVQKIFGPGNAYVVTAKRLLVGYVAIDLLPGPSEVLVLADETAECEICRRGFAGAGGAWLGPRTRMVNYDVGENPEEPWRAKIAKQLPKLARRDFIQRVLDHNTWLIQVKTIEDGVALTNQLAPEHCEVMTRNPRKLSEGILTAGAIFLGPIVADGAGRLRRRPEPHVADRRRGRVICRIDRGSISTPHERGGIQSRRAQEGVAGGEKICGD